MKPPFPHPGTLLPHGPSMTLLDEVLRLDDDDPLTADVVLALCALEVAAAGHGQQPDRDRESGGVGAFNFAEFDPYVAVVLLDGSVVQNDDWESRSDLARVDVQAPETGRYRVYSFAGICPRCGSALSLGLERTVDTVLEPEPLHRVTVHLADAPGRKAGQRGERAHRCGVHAPHGRRGGVRSAPGAAALVHLAAALASVAIHGSTLGPMSAGTGYSLIHNWMNRSGLAHVNVGKAGEITQALVWKGAMIGRGHVVASAQSGGGQLRGAGDRADAFARRSRAVLPAPRVRPGTPLLGRRIGGAAMNIDPRFLRVAALCSLASVATT